MKLIIENFQSLKDKTELEFNPGITMIIGPTNSGKTAIQRALRGLILNYRGNPSKYISHFKDNLQVDLQLDNSENVYSWIKTRDGETIYKITEANGEEQEYTKAGNKDIFSFDSGFPFVVRDKQLINTYTEKEGLPFPFNLSDIELFKMFEELYNVSSSAVIFKFMKKLETQTNSAITQHKTEIATDKDRIETVIDLEDKYDIDFLTLIKEEAQETQEQYDKLLPDIQTARKNVKISKAIKEVLENRIDPEELDKLLSKTSKQINKIKDLSVDIISANNCLEIEKINVYSEEFDFSVIEPYKALSSEYDNALKLENSLKDIVNEEEQLNEELKKVKNQLAEIKVCPLCGQSLEGRNLNE